MYSELHSTDAPHGSADGPLQSSPSEIAYQNTCAFRNVERKYKFTRTPVCSPSGKQLKKLRVADVNSVDLSDVIDPRNMAHNKPEYAALLRELPLTQTLGEKALKGFAFDGVPGLYIFPSSVDEATQKALCRAAVLDYGNAAQYPNTLSTHAQHPVSTTCYQPPMRWATIGFNYHWTTKTYDKKDFAPFPKAIQKIFTRLAQAVFEAEKLDVHLSPSQKIGLPNIYEPQSGIVNYFPCGSSMMSHQDSSEEALTQPLISVSLGCSCIFLMGTTSLDDPPFAFLLRSGDLAAFAGPSRLCYHSTTRIFDDCPAYLTIPTEEITLAERSAYDNFLFYWHVAKEASKSEDQEKDDSKGKRNKTAAFSAKEKAQRTKMLQSKRVDPAEMTKEERERYWRLVLKYMRVNINARQVYAEPCPELFEAEVNSPW